jgi:hypothetical protein
MVGKSSVRESSYALGSAGRWVALGSVALAATAATAGAAPQVIPADKALIQMQAPQATQFTVRATIPVPKGVFPRQDGQMPFHLRDSTGALIPAQVETVSSYPDIKQGSDVVEVLAQVTRPANKQPGEIIQYAVVAKLAAPVAPNLHQSIRDLINNPGKLILQTEDVFGNDYHVDLSQGKGGVKTLKDGRWAQQKRYYGMLEPVAPVGGSQGTLNHLMGVHSYVTAWADEDLLTIDLRVHNGPSGADKNDPLDDPNAKIYFKDLNVLVPPGWVVLQAFEDPMQGLPFASGAKTAYPLVVPNPDGTMHVFPVQSQMHRRLIVTPIGNEARAREVLDEEWLAFVAKATNLANGKNMWSWWNILTPRYFPQNQPMPDLGHVGAKTCRNKLTNDFNLFSGHMRAGTAQGNYPLHSPRLGWAHPWGVKYGGMTSGTEIILYDGQTTAWGASRNGYRLHQLRHRMYTDRHPTTLYNKDGEPTTVFDWRKQGNGFKYVSMNFYMRLLSGPDPFGFSAAPKWQSNYVAQNAFAPHYEADLLAHDNIDLQHLVRYTHSPKVLAWLGNDSLSKDDLKMQAEVVRLSYHQYYNSQGKAVQVSGMLADKLSVANNPGLGFSFGRGNGWAIDTMSSAFALSEEPWRRRAQHWFREVTLLVNEGQSRCNGFIQSQVNSKWLSGNFRARQSIEQAIVENALWGMKETVFRDIQPWRFQLMEAVILRSTFAMISYPAWDPVGHGPWSHLAVAPLNGTLPPYCGSLPAGGAGNGLDKYQTWSSFSYGYQLTGDPTFLARALEMSGGNNLLHSLHNTNLNNIENRFALLSLAERINYP